MNPIMSAMRVPAVLAALAASLACAACSGGVERSGAPTFPADAFTTMTSQSGALTIEVRTSPQPPERGTNAIELTITADGQPRDDLTIAVKPWMPAMNHGASAIPTVTPAGHGVYVVTEVYLPMPGHWEMQTSFSGAVTDYVAPAFDIP
jgi:hypothetical protein